MKAIVGKKICRSLKYLPCGQARIVAREGGDSIALQYHSAIICGIDNEGIIWCNNHSSIAKTYIEAFCQEINDIFNTTYTYSDFREATVEDER